MKPETMARRLRDLEDVVKLLGRMVLKIKGRVDNMYSLSELEEQGPGD